MFESVPGAAARKPDVSHSGCRSIKKSPFEVFSYWHTRVSTIGASRKAGKRWPRNRACGEWIPLKRRAFVYPDRCARRDVEANLESARFQVGHAIHFIGLNQPGRKGRSRKLASPGGNAKKENFLTARKIREPRISGNNFPSHAPHAKTNWPAQMCASSLVEIASSMRPSPVLHMRRR